MTLHFRINKREIFFIIAILLLIFGILWFLLNLLVPKSPSTPYFVDYPIEINEGPVKWQFDLIKPFYLWSYKKDNGLYFKVIYRDKKGRITLADVFAAGFYQGVDLKRSLLSVNDKVIGEIDDKNYQYPFKFGDRISIEYLSSVNLFPNSLNELICFANERANLLCQKARLSLRNYALEDFNYWGRPPIGFSLISLALYQD